jgi:hypothetical protein
MAKWVVGARWVGLAELRLAPHYGCNSAVKKRLGSTFLSMMIILISRPLCLSMSRFHRSIKAAQKVLTCHKALM